MSTSQEDGSLGVGETASEVSNGISAMLALSEQVLHIRTSYTVYDMMIAVTCPRLTTRHQTLADTCVHSGTGMQGVLY